MMGAIVPAPPLERSLADSTDVAAAAGDLTRRAKHGFFPRTRSCSKAVIMEKFSDISNKKRNIKKRGRNLTCGNI
jgi:hypothetical protein